MAATLLAPLEDSTNQTLPSAPAATPRGLLLLVGMVYSVIDPRGVTLAMRLPLYSLTQRLPSAPCAIPKGWLLLLGRAYSVKLPAVVTLATRLPAVASLSVTHSSWSGPTAMSSGCVELPDGMAYWVKVWAAGSNLVTLPSVFSTNQTLESGP